MLKQNENRVERLEARISSEQKKLFQHAASLVGKTLTAFAVSALQKAAHDIIKENEVIALSLDDQKHFAEAILNPVEPNKTLVKAAEKYKKAL